ncbi:hypothetical protein [Streptomyces thermoalcalitolerans]|uniref:Uncharacterized protein n=1 Tax=Streptomyces thermoalcalitolerans TaxID=65605 RepID=A0ABP3Z6A2_9ACTN
MGMKDKSQGQSGQAQRQGKERPGEGREKAGQRISQPQERGRQGIGGTHDERRDQDRYNQDYDR